MTMQHKQNKLQKSRRLCNDTDKDVTYIYMIGMTQVHVHIKILHNNENEETFDV